MRHTLRLLVLSIGTAALVACGEGASAARGDGSGGAAPDTVLQRLAAELLPAAEAFSFLVARAPVRLARRSKEDLEAYLIAEMARQLPPERLDAITRTYARLGLVPDTLDLEPLLRELLLEQVVGYYDPARDTLYVVERVEEAQLEMVLVHEMVHALQDQYVDLDSLMHANLEANDRSMAAQAALEGHATFAMLEWQLSALMGGVADLTELPGLDALLGDDPLAVAGVEMPVLSESPAVIRESLLFPYLGGLVFLQEHWRGPWGRVPPLGEEMPASTEQILHPERFAPATRDLPTAVVFDGGPPSGWTEVLSDGLGEMETRVLLREFLPEHDDADRAAAGWDGDRYRFLDGPAGDALVWISVWDTERDAVEFATGISAVLEARYGDDPAGRGRSLAVTRTAAEGRPVVIVTDSPTSAPLPDTGPAFRLEQE